MKRANRKRLFPALVSHSFPAVILYFLIKHSKPDRTFYGFYFLNKFFGICF